jgi:hypothetical protein
LIVHYAAAITNEERPELAPTVVRHTFVACHAKGCLKAAARERRFGSALTGHFETFTHKNSSPECDRSQFANASAIASHEALRPPYSSDRFDFTMMSIMTKKIEPGGWCNDHSRES